MRTPRQLLRKSSVPGRETLERLTRWPTLRAAWVGKMVRIWSNEHWAYERATGVIVPKDKRGGFFSCAC